MSVVNVEPGAVGQDHIGHPGVFLGFDELLSDAAGATELETPGIPKRRFLLEVPGWPDALGPPAGHSRMR